jgi:hypothetical protein
MPNLKPFRDYDESNVINLFTITGQTRVDKGTFVTAASSGVNLRDDSVVNNLSIYGNTVSALFTPAWSLATAPSGSTKNSVLGATLKDFRSFDENGENLLFHPRKAAEMDVIISGQAMPVITKGLFLYSGIATGTYGNPAAPNISDVHLTDIFTGLEVRRAVRVGRAGRTVRGQCGARESDLRGDRSRLSTAA